jgi:hypothetical protein
MRNDWCLLGIGGGMATIEIYASLMSTWSIVNDAEDVLTTDLIALKNDLAQMVGDVGDTRDRLTTAFSSNPPQIGDLEANVADMLDRLHSFSDDADDAIHQAETANDNRWGLYCGTIGFGCDPEVPTDVITNLQDMKSQMRTIKGSLKAMQQCDQNPCSSDQWASQLGQTSTCLNGACWDLHTAMVSWADKSGDLEESQAPQCSGSNTAAAQPTILAVQPAGSTEGAQLSKTLQDLSSFQSGTSNMHAALYYAALVLGAVMVVSMYCGYNHFEEALQEKRSAPLLGEREYKDESWQPILFAFAAIASGCAMTACIMKMFTISQNDVVMHDFSVPLRQLPDWVDTISECVGQNTTTGCNVSSFLVRSAVQSMVSSLEISLSQLTLHLKEASGTVALLA